MRYNLRDSKGRFVKKGSIKREGEFWVDSRNNRWDDSWYSKEEAEYFSASLIDCRNCTNCKFCNHCNDCSWCSYCRNCNGCSSCINCSYCSGCSYCNHCSDCDSFSKNPERVIGLKMGSRNDFPSVYWTKVGKEQCVVGCFRGTLDELEKAVEETHKNNKKYLTQYRKFIRLVRLYQKGMK